MAWECLICFWKKTNQTEYFISVSAHQFICSLCHPSSSPIWPGKWQSGQVCLWRMRMMRMMRMMMMSWQPPLSCIVFDTCMHLHPIHFPSQTKHVYCTTQRWTPTGRVADKLPLWCYPAGAQWNLASPSSAGKHQLVSQLPSLSPLP